MTYAQNFGNVCHQLQRSASYGISVGVSWFRKQMACFGLSKLTCWEMCRNRDMRFAYLQSSTRSNKLFGWVSLIEIENIWHISSVPKKCDLAPDHCPGNNAIAAKENGTIRSRYGQNWMKWGAARWTGWKWVFQLKIGSVLITDIGHCHWAIVPYTLHQTQRPTPTSHVSTTTLNRLASKSML